MTDGTDKIGALLLAAGGSSRMGRPKQLLFYEGQTLLRRAAETLLATACSLVIVVLGSEFEQTRKQIKGLPVVEICNENWQTGMGSSIKAGVTRLLQVEPDASGLIITLCDQPHITSSHIDQLIKKFRETGCGIVAAEYAGTTGVPALFGRRYFDELLNMEGDRGARKLIHSASADLSKVQIPEAAFDIDSPEDLISKRS